MSQENFDSLLSAATTYGSQVTATFNLFLTVAFGSLAFAAAKPLGNIGSQFLGFSTTSLVMALVLLSFYIICFLSFRKAEKHLNSLLFELHERVEKWGIHQGAVDAFKPNNQSIFGLSLPSFGFVLGSTGCLLIFVWVSNAERLAYIFGVWL